VSGASEWCWGFQLGYQELRMVLFRRWIENYHQIKEQLEKISQINRELLRRERQPKRVGGRLISGLFHSFALV
jgi:hypothetical protein